MIISISGLIGSGKDTIADYLVNTHGYRRESWAGTLKDAVGAVFGWDRTLLEGRTAHSRQWREERDTWWSERLGLEITPRRVLQEWGTEVCRSAYHDDIWIASLENKLRNTQDNIVITDTRFSNELVSVNKLGGITVRVVRGQQPDWVDEYLRDGATPQFKERYPHIHASEYSSVGLNYDYYITNDGTLEELYSQINDLLQSRQ